jgi:hypothetical protein
VGTEIFFGKTEIRLDSPVNKLPDGQITLAGLVVNTVCFSINGSCEAPINIQDVGWVEPAKPIISIRCN